MSVTEPKWIDLRLMGPAEQQDQMREVLATMGQVLDVAWSETFAPNKRDGGVRAFVQVRIPVEPKAATPDA